MDYCAYHPLRASTYECDHCGEGRCDRCVDNDTLCLVCNRPTESLGARNNVEPFWRRLQAAFRYPFNTGTVSLIVVVSVMSGILSILSSLVLFIALYLISTGAIMKYSFRALEDTARGRMVAPDIADAFQGGIGLLFQLVLMVLALIGIVFAAGHFIGGTAAALLAFFFIIGLPAMLISFGLNHDLITSINPVNTFRLMTAIGLPYGLLLALIMVMMGSVTVLHQFIGDDWLVVSYILQNMASNYYLIVIFHIMGYMIFQYQGQLGFHAREDYGDGPVQRSDENLLGARIDIALKRGDYQNAYTLFNQALNQFPDNKIFPTQYFDCAHQLEDTAELPKAATAYLRFAHTHGQQARLLTVFNQVRTLLANYIPDHPDLRLALARDAAEQGDSKTAIHLLNGLHKRHPDYPRLPDAFHLLADLLDRQPDRETQAKQCRQLAAQLSERLSQQRVSDTGTPRTGKAMFDVEPREDKPEHPGTSESEIATEPSEGDGQELKPIEFR
ncbi:hypothetical protein [Saccharospirillum salsuginis]|uniref:Tetratricopeptide repeat protein n=1 Tax=Saccharospirillum salsuginis TaxID=418750 RepID=A0A918KKS1_9GAMM|nr:hypothetical protein [Saccharospirillum salsuginis]GGX67539.1 hypothetical protein GCM10007392_38960 [Saccharospirillum salsuginis]